MMEGKWIFFGKLPRKPKMKTDVYTVHNKESGVQVGVVKWYGPFRQYSFFPDANMVFERQCLLDITKFIHHLMIERKVKKQIAIGL